MSTILILFSIAFGCFFILYLFNQNDKKKVSDFYNVYTPNGLQLIQKLEEMLENNETLRMTEEMFIYEKMFGKFPRDASDNLYDVFMTSIGLDGWDTAPEGSLKSIAGDYFTGLTFSLSERYDTQYKVLKGINEQEAMDKFGLNINSNEEIYVSIDKMDWYEEKTITTSYTYGGLQYKMSLGKGFTYRVGNLTVIPNKTDKFLPVDRGSLYITNKRIIFIGTEKHINKTIDVHDILEFDIFMDGILIGKPNGKKPLIVFPEWIIKPKQAPNKRDDINKVVRILDRLLRNDQAQDLSKEYVSNFG